MYKGVTSLAPTFTMVTLATKIPLLNLRIMEYFKNNPVDAQEISCLKRIRFVIGTERN